ncbi:MAG: M81 family metallopeptidase [Candidatus Symbiobacter sp.]|nr:M81 family metallopeptidase [Candidatus Symbiobacter sp.]
MKNPPNLPICVAGFQHETNSFDPNPTPIQSFITPTGWPGLTEGENLYAAMAGRNLALAGFIDQAKAMEYPVIPILWANAPPGGLVSDQAFQEIMSRLLRRLGQVVATMPIQAVYLDLHGAMITASHPDAETEILRLVRGVIGDAPWLIASLDWHANVTADMVAAADWLTIYRTYPHIDMRATGVRLAARLPFINRPIARHFRRIPYLIPLTAQCSLAEPMRSLLTERDKISPDDDAKYEINFAAGFPPSDVEFVGPCVFGYDCGAGDATLRVAAKTDSIYHSFIAAQADFAAEKIFSIAEALDITQNHPKARGKPVVIADTQDNPGAGATSDTNFMLRAVMHTPRSEETNFFSIGIALYCDPDAAARAHQLQVGEVVNMSLGGRSGVPGDAPINFLARIGALWDGEFPATGAMWGGGMLNLGKMARLDVVPGHDLGDRGGISIFVASVRQQPSSLAIFTQLGCDPSQFSLLILKSSVHFRADWQERAARILVVAAPDFAHGLNLADPGYFRYLNYRPSPAS